MDKILTIAIPAYNMSEYICRCLDSVTNSQRLDKLDVIVVNDGSKDDTLILAKRYEERFPDSVRVIDKPNGGWGTAINRSIVEAKGKYYKSLDSDDWFDTGNLDKYVDLLSNLDVDMVLTSFNEVDEMGVKTGGITWDMYTDQLFSFDDYLRSVPHYYSTIHAITYRTAILQKNKITVCERFYGDLDYINTPLIYVKSIYVSPLNVYQYFVGRAGQSISIAGYKAHIDDYLLVARKSILFNASCGDTLSESLGNVLWSETLARVLWAYKLLMLPSYLGQMPESKSKLKDLDSFVKLNHPKLYKKLAGVKSKKIIPYIWLWRISGINIFNLLR